MECTLYLFSEFGAVYKKFRLTYLLTYLLTYIRRLVTSVQRVGERSLVSRNKSQNLHSLVRSGHDRLCSLTVLKLWTGLEEMFGMF